MNSLRKNISKWLEVSSERIKIQRFYLSLAFCSFVLASIVSLVDGDLGRTILMITVASSVIFLLNATIWTLGEALISNFIIAKTPTKRKK